MSEKSVAIDNIATVINARIKNVTEAGFIAIKVYELVFENELASIKEKMEKQETELVGLKYGSTALKIVGLELKIKELEAQIVLLRAKLEEIGKILDRGGWSRDAEILVAQALSSDGSELLEAVREARAQLEYCLKNHRDHTGFMNATHLSEQENLKKVISKLGRFV